MTGATMELVCACANHSHPLLFWVLGKRTNLVMHTKIHDAWILQLNLPILVDQFHFSWLNLTPFHSSFSCHSFWYVFQQSSVLQVFSRNLESYADAFTLCVAYTRLYNLFRCIFFFSKVNRLNFVFQKKRMRNEWQKQRWLSLIPWFPLRGQLTLLTLLLSAGHELGNAFKLFLML